MSALLVPVLRVILIVRVTEMDFAKMSAIDESNEVLLLALGRPIQFI